MTIIDIIIIFYLILTLLISFTISFLYLNYFRHKVLTSCFTLYFCMFLFGLMIYLIFLVSLDHAISFRTGIEDNSILIKDLLNILELWYLYFGYISKFVKYFFAPVMILFYTTGFYNKCDIVLDIFFRLLSKYIFTKINICLFTVFLIPIFILLYLGKLWDFYENEVKLFLNYLNYYSYLRILFYIGFMIQNYIRMFALKKDLGEKENYNIWKLGKLYIYYEREKKNIIKNYNLIKKEIEEYYKEYQNKINDDFKHNVKKFEDCVYSSLKNIFYYEPDIEGIKFSNKKYTKNYINKNKKAENLFGLNKINENIDNINEENIDNKNEENIDNINEENIELNSNIDIDNKNVNLEYQNRDEEINLCEKNDEKYKYNLLKEGKSNKKCIEYNIIHCCCGWISCKCLTCCNCCIDCNCCKRNQKYKNFKEFKNIICLLMDEVYELCVSIQRKSFLIDQKYKICQEENKLDNDCCKCFLQCCLDCGVVCIWFILLLILLIVEYPTFEISLNKDINAGYLLNLYIWIIFFFSSLFYFLIFNYSIIHHQYIEGNIIFGKKQSQNVNYYTFISLMLDYINALLFHSTWVLNKNQTINSKFSKVFILKPIIINNDINIVPYISIAFIIICIYNTFTFSKIKICDKNYIVFNENSDFFGFEEKFYGNFYIGCGCLLFISKNGLIHKDPDIKHIQINEN